MLYAQIRAIHQNFAAELELQSGSDPNLVLAGMNAAPYMFKRA